MLQLAASEFGLHHKVCFSKPFLHIALAQMELIANVGALFRETGA